MSYAARPLTVDALKLLSAEKPGVASVAETARGKLIAPEDDVVRIAVVMVGVGAVVADAFP